uniref:Uncharacterized protein n=1 Tax=Gossypium raimondii TaxID=29730 RepID=A0A0D2RNC6_GOSRA|nr:hypothetical protein B456_011G163900 [Gossypium raimondii]
MAFQSIGFLKPQQYYENILAHTGSVLFKHYIDPKDPNFITHSTAQILKILRPRDWSENPNSPKKFPAKFTTKIDHYSYFTYWDYQTAWYNAFLMNNQHLRHSWLIYFKYGTQFKFPNWFQEWWNYLNQTKNTFTGQSIFLKTQDQYTGIPLLVRNYRTKWWDKFNDEKYDSKYLDNFFNKNPRLYKFAAPDQTTAKFLQAKSTASAMLT